MKITKTVLACLAVLALFALTAGRAIAGADNCSGPSSGCGFGSIVNTQTTYYDSTGTTALTAQSGGFQLTETVYQLTGGSYAYVFDLTNNSANAAEVLTNESAFTGSSGSGVDEFNPNYNFGVITGTPYTTSGATYGIGGTNGDGFSFNPGALSVSFSLQPNGNSFTFYAEGTGPTNGGWSSHDGVVLQASTLGPAHMPEPGVLTLLGSLLLVLLLGAPLATRLRTTTA